MLLFLLLLSVHEDSAKKTVISCNGLIFDHVYFEKDVMVENLGRPYNLVHHKYSNTLFFSHTTQNGTEVDFEIIACDLNKKECKKIEGISGGYAIAYDSGNDDVYLGGHDGIYKYNFFTKSAEFFAEEGKSIWGLFVRNSFYYIEYPTQKLYVYADDKFAQVAEAVNIEVDNFYISKRNEIYFSNKTALYKVDRITKTTIELNDEVNIRQIVEDTYGDIYFCGNGIYVELKPYERVKKLANIEAFGMTFDENDRIILSDRNSIFRLLPSDNNVACSQYFFERMKDGEKEFILS